MRAPSLRLPLLRARQTLQHAEVKTRQWIERRTQPLERGLWFAEFFADGAQDGADSRWFRPGNSEKPAKATRHTAKGERFPGRFLRRQLAGLAGTAQEIQQRGFLRRQALPSFRPSGVNDGLGADELTRQARLAGRNFSPRACLSRETQKAGRSDSCREEVLIPFCQVPQRRPAQTGPCRVGEPARRPKEHRCRIARVVRRQSRPGREPTWRFVWFPWGAAARFPCHSI